MIPIPFVLILSYGNAFQNRPSLARTNVPHCHRRSLFLGAMREPHQALIHIHPSELGTLTYGWYSCTPPPLNERHKF